MIVPSLGRIRFVVASSKKSVKSNLFMVIFILIDFLDQKNHTKQNADSVIFFEISSFYKKRISFYEEKSFKD